MKNRKPLRIIAILMAICMPFGMLTTAVTAFAAPGDQTLLPVDEATGASPAQSAVLVGEALYAISGRELVAFDLTQEEPGAMPLKDLTEVDPTGVARLLLTTDGQDLYLLNASGGALFRYADGAMEKTLDLDTEELDATAGDLSQISLRTPVMMEDALLVLCSDPSSYLSYRMLRFSLADGSCSQLESAALTQLAAYQDGQLLAVQADLMAMSTGVSDAFPQVVAVDPVTGSVTQQLGQLSSMYDGGAAFDASTGKVYAVSSSQLVEVTAQGNTPVNYLSGVYAFNAGYAGVTEGRYVFQDETGIRLRSTDAQYMSDNPLRIQGMTTGSEAIQAFGRAHPEIPVIEITEISQGTEALTNSMMSGDDSADIYALTSLADLDQLIRRGYVPPIESEVLLADVQTMYPQIQELLIRDGQVYGYPFLMGFQPWALRRDLLEEFGLEEPATLLAYYELMNTWYADYAYDNTDVQFENTMGQGVESLRLFAISNVLYQYAMTYETGDAPLSFDTLQFREVMAQIEQLPYEEKDMDIDAVMDSILNAQTQYIYDHYNADVFGLAGAYNAQEGAEVSFIAPPPFEADGEQHIQSVLYFYVINPNSANQENARTFLEFTADHLDTRTDYYVHPEKNEPTERTGYEAQLETSQQMIAELEAQLEAADPDARQAIEDTLAEARSGLEQLQNNRYEYGEEGIAAYRAIAPHMNFMQHVSLIDPDNPTALNELNNVIYAYLGGQTTMDQAIADLDGKLRMIYQESQ